MDDVKVTGLGDFAAAKAKMQAKGPNQDAIAMAREMLSRCESGELRGVLVFTATADGVGHALAGDLKFGDMLLAFEEWKLGVLLARRE
jgi:hypothetical protein